MILKLCQSFSLIVTYCHFFVHVKFLRLFDFSFIILRSVLLMCIFGIRVREPYQMKSVTVPLHYSIVFNHRNLDFSNNTTTTTITRLCRHSAETKLKINKADLCDSFWGELSFVLLLYKTRFISKNLYRYIWLLALSFLRNNICLILSI